MVGGAKDREVFGIISTALARGPDVVHVEPSAILAPYAVAVDVRALSVVAVEHLALLARCERPTAVSGFANSDWSESSGCERVFSLEVFVGRSVDRSCERCARSALGFQILDPAQLLERRFFEDHRRFN